MINAMSDKIQKKILQIKEQTSFSSLKKTDKEFIINSVKKYRLTFQESKNLVDVILDFHIWDEPIGDFIKNVETKAAFLEPITKKWKSLKEEANSYESFSPDKRKAADFKFQAAEKASKILGKCPVASEKTRCCNLMTLDVVRNCGYDCNYCCIQSFFYENSIFVEENLKEKLKNLKLDKNKIYHIGTGQSSDSLMWGDKFNHLNILKEYLEENQNVILELKTKSANVKEFLKIDFPQNIICTWSINTETIIKNEERLTASLYDRLEAARMVADKGVKIGFHFHPMIYYKEWKNDYKDVFDKILEMFKPEEVVMISFGTLTYIKPVVKKIRKRDFKSKVLQMPLNDVEGKLSYPKETKLKLFKHLYDSFMPWHGKVYFYMCMEEIDLWKKVFGMEYKNNDDFEKDMIKKYLDKLNS